MMDNYDVYLKIEHQHVYNICQIKQMYGLSTSQWVSSLTILTSIVFYFCANTGLKQNAFLYIFAIALTVLIVDVMFMNDRAFEYEPHYENWMKRREKQNQ